MDQGQAPEQPISIEDKFQAILAAEHQPPTEPAQEPESTDAANTRPEAGDPVDSEGDQAVEEVPAEEAPPVIEIDPTAPNFEVTVKTEGGAEEVKKVSLEELERGFMMQADYQRKTAELARQREALSKEVEEKVKPVQQQYEQNLQLFMQYAKSLADAELQNVDWGRLAKEDPAEFVRLNQRNKEIQGLWEYAQQELLRQDQQRQAKWTQEKQQAAQKAVEELSDPVRGIKGWNNQLYESVLKAGVDNYGFKFEEVGNVTDPRMIKVLHDAYKYRELQAAKPIVEKRVAAIPKVVKPGNADRSEKPNPEKDLMKRLKQSGGKDKDSLTALFENRISRK